MLKIFILGVLVGWLAEWVLDWFWWRRSDGPAVNEGLPFNERMALNERTALNERPAVTTASTRSADTPAGTVASAVAVGAPGAVSTSSATMSTQAPVYRQQDLEAIIGLGPRHGALLRQHGIRTFGDLAGASIDMLAGKLRETARADGAAVAGAASALAVASVDNEAIRAWQAQAALAAAGDWAGFAVLQKRPVPAIPQSDA